MNIEAIAFDSAATIDTLPEPEKVPEGASLLTTLTEDDIFRRRLPVPTFVQTTPSEVTSEPVAITETRTEPPAPDPLQSVRFVASVWNGQHREAWLVDQRSNNEQTVLATSRLEFPGIEGTVIAVDGDTLQVELEGQQRVIQLGRTLAEITSAR